MSNDDLALVQTMAVDLSSSSTPMGLRRERFVVLHLDADYCLPEFTAQLRAVVEQLSGVEHVGLGLLSMLGFDSTCSHLEEVGISREVLDFVVCNR